MECKKLIKISGTMNVKILKEKFSDLFSMCMSKNVNQVPLNLAAKNIRRGVDDF